MKAAITGIGVVSPFGLGRERFWSCVRAGCSATRLIPEFEVVPRDPELQIEREVVVRQEQALARWTEQAARVHIPQNRVVERIVARAVEDLGALPLLEVSPERPSRR